MALTVLDARSHHSDTELAEEGSRYPAAHLTDGARAILTYARQDETALTPWNRGGEWRELMKAAIDAVAGAEATRTNVQAGARPSGVKSLEAAQALIDWVHTFEAAISVADPNIAAAAPYLPARWDKATQLASAVAPLVAFAKAQNALNVPGGLAAFASEGGARLAAYEASRSSHQGELARLSPEVTAMHVQEGIVAFELQALARLTKNILPARAELYETKHLSGRKASNKPAQVEADATVRTAPPTK